MLRTLEEKVDPRHTALVVVDIQNHFCTDCPHPKPREGLPAIQAMVPRLMQLIDAARTAGLLVVFTQAIHAEDNVSEVQLEHWLRTNATAVAEEFPLHCRDGTWDADFYMVSPLVGEPIVKKHRYGAFINTDLDLILRSHGVRSLIMTGVSTQACVESTARDGFMHDYYIVFVGDCAASLNIERHESTLDNIRDGFGLVVTAEEITSIWSKAGVAQAAS